MAVTFSMTRNEIIEKAFRRLGVLGEGEYVSDDMYNSAAQDLNLVVKGLQRFRKTLWRLEEGEATVTEPDAVSNGGTDYYCIQSHTADAASEPGAGDDWEQYWYAGSTSEDSPAAWVTGTAYGNGSTIELDADTAAIEVAHYIDSDDTIPLKLINRFQKADLAFKWETGTPSQLHFDRYASTPVMKIYPLADETYRIPYTRIVIPADISLHGQDSGVPATWLDYLIYALAVKQGDEYSIDPVKLSRLQKHALTELRLNINDQVEETGTQFVTPAY